MSKARAAIDFRYFMGDALMKTGAALGVFLAAIVVLTPFRMSELPTNAQAPYGLVLGLTAVLAVFLAISGRRMRRSAAKLDRS